MKWFIIDIYNRFISNPFSWMMLFFFSMFYLMMCTREYREYTIDIEYCNTNKHEIVTAIGFIRPSLKTTNESVPILYVNSIVAYNVCSFNIISERIIEVE